MGKKEKSENNVEVEQTSPQTTELTPKAIFLLNDFQSNIEELKKKWANIPILDRNKLKDQLHDLYRKVDKTFILKELAARWVYAVKAARLGFINDAFVEFEDLFLFASKDPKLEMIKGEANATLDILKDQIKTDEIVRIKTAISEGQTRLWVVKDKTQEEIGKEQLNLKEVEAFSQQFKAVFVKIYAYLKETVPCDFRQKIANTSKILAAIPSYMKEREFEQGALEILEARAEFYQGKNDSGTNRLMLLIQNASLKDFLKDIVNESNEALLQFQGKPAPTPTTENAPAPAVETVAQPELPFPIPLFQPPNIEPVANPIQQTQPQPKVEPVQQAPAPNIASIFSIPSTPATVPTSSIFSAPQVAIKPDSQQTPRPASIFSTPTSSIFSTGKASPTMPTSSIFSNPATPAPTIAQTPQYISNQPSQQPQYNPNQPNPQPQQYRPPLQPQNNPNQPNPQPQQYRPPQQPQYNPNQPNPQPQQYRPPQQPPYNPNQPYQQSQYQPYQQPPQYRQPQPQPQPQPQQYTPSTPSLFAKSSNRAVQQQPPTEASTTYRCPMCGAFVDRRIYSYCPVCNGVGFNPYGSK